MGATCLGSRDAVQMRRKEGDPTAPSRAQTVASSGWADICDGAQSGGRFPGTPCWFLLDQSEVKIDLGYCKSEGLKNSSETD